MPGSWCTAALALCPGIVIVLVLSSVFIFFEADRVCPAEDCEIYARVLPPLSCRAPSCRQAIFCPLFRPRFSPAGNAGPLRASLPMWQRPSSCAKFA